MWIAGPLVLGVGGMAWGWEFSEWRIIAIFVLWAGLSWLSSQLTGEADGEKNTERERERERVWGSGSATGNSVLIAMTGYLPPP